MEPQSHPNPGSKLLQISTLIEDYYKILEKYQVPPSKYDVNNITRWINTIIAGGVEYYFDGFNADIVEGHYDIQKKEDI